MQKLRKWHIIIVQLVFFSHNAKLIILPLLGNIQVKKNFVTFAKTVGMWATMMSAATHGEPGGYFYGFK